VRHLLLQVLILTFMLDGKFLMQNLQSGYLTVLHQLACSVQQISGHCHVAVIIVGFVEASSVGGAPPDGVCYL
jgi:hypothetical protein